MKTIVLGDVHGESVWEEILHSEQDYQRVIFLGDYLDTHKKDEDFTAAKQLNNLEQIVRFKEQNEGKIEVILLIGNHDHHYWPGVPGGSTSGYQRFNAQFYTQFFQEKQKHFRMAYADEHDRLFSHAGISTKWLVEVCIYDTNPKVVVEKINELFYHRPKHFCYYWEDYSGYGDHPKQSPIWIRPDALKTCMLPPIQFVGHTRTKGGIELGKSLRTNLWQIDALAFERHSDYIVLEDEKITIHTQIHG